MFLGMWGFLFKTQEDMARLIIPDRICSHCGGNEWYKLHREGRGVYFRCVVRVAESSSANYHKTVSKAKESMKRRTDTLTDSYIIPFIVKKYGIPSEKVTMEQINDQRAKVIAFRKRINSFESEHPEYNYKHLPIENKKERERLCKRQARAKARITLSDTYIRHVIKNTMRKQSIRNGETPLDLRHADISLEAVTLYREGLQQLKNLKQLTMTTKISTLDEYQSLVDAPEKESIDYSEGLTTIRKNKQVHQYKNLGMFERFLKLTFLRSLLEDPHEEICVSVDDRNNRRSLLRKELGVRSIDDVKQALTTSKKEMLEYLQASLQEDIKELAKLNAIPKENQNPTQVIIESLQKIEEAKQEIRNHKIKIEELLLTI